MSREECSKLIKMRACRKKVSTETMRAHINGIRDQVLSAMSLILELNAEQFSITSSIQGNKLRFVVYTRLPKRVREVHFKKLFSPIKLTVHKAEKADEPPRDKNVRPGVAACGLTNMPTVTNSIRNVQHLLDFIRTTPNHVFSFVERANEAFDTNALFCDACLNFLGQELSEHITAIRCNPSAPKNSALSSCFKKADAIIPMPAFSSYFIMFFTSYWPEDDKHQRAALQCLRKQYTSVLTKLVSLSNSPISLKPCIIVCNNTRISLDLGVRILSPTHRSTD
jgi:hypothetical protein